MEDLSTVELKVCLQDQRQFNCARKLLSNTEVLDGGTVARVLRSVLSFLEKASDTNVSGDVPVYVHNQRISSIGISCVLEYTVKAPEDQQPQVTSLEVSFPASLSRLKFVGLTDKLFSSHDGKSWELVEHEWKNIQVKFTAELLDIASSSSPASDDFLPSPLYHFLLELLGNSISPLQVGLIKSSLRSLRLGTEREIPFYGDTVLSNICRDLLLPLTYTPVPTDGHRDDVSAPVKNLSSLAMFRAVFHGPSGTGKTRIARFIAEECGFRTIFCGTPHQLNHGYNYDANRFKQVVGEQLSLLPSVPSVFILDAADQNVPPLGCINFVLEYLADAPNLFCIVVTNDILSIDKNFLHISRLTQVYFSRPYARNRTEMLAQIFASHGFKRVASVMRMHLARADAVRLRKLICGRSGGQLLALGESCVRRCALDDPANANPEWEFVLLRMERASRDLLFAADLDTCDWSAGDEIDPPREWNEVVLGANNQLSGRVLCDVEEGKLLIEYADGKVHPLWFARAPHGPCVMHQLALGFAASLVEPSTVIVVDSRRLDLISGDVESSAGYAKLVSDLRSAGSRGGALVVIDVDDLVGVIKDSSSRVLLLNRHIQDPVHKYETIKLLREYVLHKIISFSSLASFVTDVSEKHFCLVVAVTRESFVRERLTTAWQTNLNMQLETSFVPRGLHVSQAIVTTQDEEDDDISGSVCAKLELQAGDSYLWIVKVCIANGFVSLGVIHSSINTLGGRMLYGALGENFGTWGFRITPSCVEVSQSASIPSKTILSPLPEAHENPMRTTVRNNRATFGVFLQSTPSGTLLHLLRFVHQRTPTSNSWEHVAYKRIDDLDGLNLMPAFGIARRSSSVQVVACHRVSSTWFPCDALPDAPVNHAFVPALRNASTIALYKGGFHLTPASVYLDKTRISSGKQALIRFHVFDKTPVVVPELKRSSSNLGMNVLIHKIIPENTPRLSIGFIKESAVNCNNVLGYNIYGYNPNLARCYFGHDYERDVPSLMENPQKNGFLFLDLCSTSPYCGSIHYLKIGALGNMVYSGSLMEGLSNEPYRAAVSFDDPTTEQGKLLGTLGTVKIGTGLGRELLPMHIPEWYPLDYGVPQGLYSFSPDPNTFRQERDGMNSRFTKELTPSAADWHYIECRISSYAGNSQVILGFIPANSIMGTRNSYAGARGTLGFGYSVLTGEVYLGSSSVTRANTRFTSPPKDYIRIGLLLSAKLGEVHLFWAEVGIPGPANYKGLLFENVTDTSYRFVISASSAGTAVTWRGFACNGTLLQAKNTVAGRNLDFNELSGSVSYASKNYVVFPGMDITGDDISVLPNATTKQLRAESDRLGAGAFTSSGTIKDYAKIYRRMRIVENRVELAGLIGPVCSDFCLRIHIQGYVFLPQHDAIGDELDAETADLQAVAQRCTQDPNALAFNTGGFIKFSLKSWVLYLADPGASGCFSGIFVKQSYMCLWLGTADAKECLNTIRSLVGGGPAIISDNQSNWAIN